MEQHVGQALRSRGRISLSLGHYWESSMAQGTSPPYLLQKTGRERREGRLRRQPCGPPATAGRCGPWG